MARRRLRHTMENFGLFRRQRRAAQLAAKIPENIRNSVVLKLDRAGFGDQFRSFAMLWNIVGTPDIFIDVSRFLIAPRDSFDPIDPADLPRLLSRDFYRAFELFDYDIMPFVRSRHIKFVSFPKHVSEYFFHTGRYDVFKVIDGNTPIIAPRMFNISFLDIERPCKYRDEIRKTFKFIGGTNDANRRKLAEIRGCENSICMHIRRGDFIKHMHGRTIRAEYFSNAIHEIVGAYGIRPPNEISPGVCHTPLQAKSTVFVFSEDIEWARQNIDFNLPNVTVDFVNINDSRHPAREIELMRACKNYIVSLGYFAQTAAFLNDGNPIIIHPTGKDYCKV